MYANPHAVLLLDHPDAQLEILRQRQAYRAITEELDAIARAAGNEARFV